MRIFALLLLFFATGTALASEPSFSEGSATSRVSGFMYNKARMEGKYLIGFNGNFILPMGTLGDQLKPTPGFGLSGKYFGTDYFAFGFNFSFSAPKVKDVYIEEVDNEYLTGLVELRDNGQVPDSANLIEVVSGAHYIPFFVSLEFYLPSQMQKKFRPYAALDLGIVLVNENYEGVYNVPRNQAIQNMENNTGMSFQQPFFGAGARIGFLASLDELWHIDMNMAYAYLSSEKMKSSALTFNVGLVFNLAYKY